MVFISGGNAGSLSSKGGSHSSSPQPSEKQGSKTPSSG